ncbi:MAG: hypothetical protein DDT20_00835 [Firmicutes bacterium]|nr:hypothetical protein [Bacillota bacterium]
MMTTQKEVRIAFWQAFDDNPNISRRKIVDYAGTGKMYTTGARCAFVDFVDRLARDGVISAALAQRVTL